MWKNIRNIWKIHLQELYLMLAILLGFGVLGIIALPIILRFDLESSYFTMGTFMAALLWIMVNGIWGIFGFGGKFNLVVSMGCRRKDYFIANTITLYLYMMVEAAVILVMYVSEKRLWSMVFSDREYEQIMDYFMNYRMLIACVFLIPPMRVLLDAIILRFKTKAYMIISLLWMVAMLGSGRFISYIKHHPDNLVVVFMNNIQSMSDIVKILVVFFFTGGMLALGYFFTRKQAVYI